MLRLVLFYPTRPVKLAHGASPHRVAAQKPQKKRGGSRPSHAQQPFRHRGKAAPRTLGKA